MKSAVSAGAAAGVLIIAGCSAGGGQAAAPAGSAPASTSAPASPTAGPTPTVPASPTAALPAVYDCAGKPRTQPTGIILACADAGDVLTRITWLAWSAGGAAGAGQLGVNNCQPTCAGGSFGYTPVKITLAQPASGAGGPYFTRLTLSGPHVPAQLRTWTLGKRGPGS